MPLFCLPCRPQTLPQVARNAARSPHSAELEPAVADLPGTDAQPAEEWYFDLGLAKYSTTVDAQVLTRPEGSTGAYRKTKLGTLFVNESDV